EAQELHRGYPGGEQLGGGDLQRRDRGRIDYGILRGDSSGRTALPGWPEPVPPRPRVRDSDVPQGGTQLPAPVQAMPAVATAGEAVRLLPMVGVPALLEGSGPDQEEDHGRHEGAQRGPAEVQAPRGFGHREQRLPEEEDMQVLSLAPGDHGGEDGSSSLGTPSLAAGSEHETGPPGRRHGRRTGLAVTFDCNHGSGLHDGRHHAPVGTSITTAGAEHPIQDRPKGHQRQQEASGQEGPGSPNAGRRGVQAVSGTAAVPGLQQAKPSGYELQGPAKQDL
ncbi:unnamed protein product, partial [Symbiodinium sp. CCMP2456]